MRSPRTSLRDAALTQPSRAWRGTPTCHVELGYNPSACLASLLLFICLAMVALNVPFDKDRGRPRSLCDPTTSPRHAGPLEAGFSIETHHQLDQLLLGRRIVMCSLICVQLSVGTGWPLVAERSMQCEAHLRDEGSREPVTNKGA